MKRTTVVLITICAGLWFARVALRAQNPQGAATTLKAGAELVQVPVVVQRSGKHVGGLKESNFVVEQDGKKQPIAVFEEVHAAAPSATAVAAGEFGNANITRPQEITIIAIDTVNTPTMDQAYFREELLKFLSEAVNRGVPFGLVELNRSGIRVLHDFTTDPRTLIATVQNRRGTLPTRNDQRSPQLAEAANEASQQLDTASNDQLQRAQAQFDAAAALLENEDRMARFQDRTARIDTLGTLQQLAQAMKGLPGRKSLIWVGSGFQFLGGLQQVSGITRTSPTGTTNLGEAQDQHAYTWKLLNDANVAVYPIDTRRTANTAYEVIDPSRKYTPLASEREVARSRDQEIITTFESIAAQTGGKPCIYRTDLHNCLREAADDSEDYYLLGFYVDKSNSAPGWHKIKVTLDQKANVRYRSGFLIAKDVLPAPSSADVQLALHSPVAYTALPFYGRFDEITSEGSKKAVSYELTVPPDSITIEPQSGRINFDVVALVRAVGGKEAARSAQRIQRSLTPQNISTIKADGIRYTNKIVLDPGEYGVWFVVRDNLSGRTGSAVVDLKVP